MIKLLLNKKAHCKVGFLFGYHFLFSDSLAITLPSPSNAS